MPKVDESCCETASPAGVDESLPAIKAENPLAKALSIFAPVLSSVVMRLVALIVLICVAPAYEIFHRAAVRDLDVWWHLRVGDWIVQNHAVPRTGLFSQLGENMRWAAYSWGFEIILARVYHWWGLVGLSILRMSFLAIIGYVLFTRLRRVSNCFWGAWLLTGFGMWAIYQTTGPRPALFTIVLITAELGLLFEARQTGSYRPLLWLIPMFAFWANVHIQFVYGLFLLALFVAGQVFHFLVRRWYWPLAHDLQGRMIPLGPVIFIGAGSALATLISPYSTQLYRVIYGYTQSTFAYQFITENQALNFRQPAHYVLLLIVCLGFLVLGWQKRLDPFKIALLISTTLVAFRAVRDGWFGVIPALFVIADWPVANNDSRERPPVWEAVAVLAAAMAILVIGGRTNGLSETSSAQAVESIFPVRACDYVLSHRMERPLYNTYDWGGFIIWKMPQYPVAIDGRSDLYGDEINMRFWNVQQGFPAWTSDPDLNRAKLLLIDKRVPLGAIMANDQRFELMYQDEISAVFRRR